MFSVTEDLKQIEINALSKANEELFAENIKLRQKVFSYILFIFPLDKLKTYLNKNTISQIILIYILFELLQVKQYERKEADEKQRLKELENKKQLQEAQRKRKRNEKTKNRRQRKLARTEQSK